MVESYREDGIGGIGPKNDLAMNSIAAHPRINDWSQSRSGATEAADVRESTARIVRRADHAMFSSAASPSANIPLGLSG
jgi:hypothetical protein